ncbi:glutamate 5-kinase [Desulfofundulus thermobenzoicus]|uniref:Glutamate 5-kinase n=1 Tax=Desulfofundulus thermobenzoicus TaxID=29376 RepID=A0A6N7IUR3_9FIRM|nr:glutamate 5-kinase [Desulfofundulus thermobenzoicus]MQL53824.1 glutamate 5-kinase [Desulfofundulus thermobenzoicus]
MSGERDLGNVRRVVVKVGSSSLIYPTGRPNLSQMEKLVRQLADLHNQGREVLLVTSGAIGVGQYRLGYTRRPKTIPEKQAAAAVGQGMLVHIYEKFFAEYGVTVGQVLLTREDFSDRRRFLNARNTLYTLLRLGVVPVINENDTVAVEEIKLGDNDNLAALVSTLVDADLLILLSDIDGLYEADPRHCREARLIDQVREITPELEKCAGGAGTSLGTGGIVTKLQAARIAMHSGIITVLARSTEPDVVRRVVSGESLGTIFWPSGRMDNKKRWIAFSSTVCGCLYVDEGAARALLEHGKSLLPSGIIRVEGSFEMGNTVSICDPAGKEIARGIVNYSSPEVERIKGLQTKEIARVLGYKDYDEVVHRNNLVLDV